MKVTIEKPVEVVSSGEVPEGEIWVFHGGQKLAVITYLDADMDRILSEMAEEDKDEITGRRANP